MGRQQNRQRQRRVQRRQETRRQQQINVRAEGIGFNSVAFALGALVVLAALGLFFYGATRPSSASAPQSTPTAQVSAAPAVDGVQCNASENLAYHIHQHIALYDNGKYVALPSEIGIPGTEVNPQCYYWIHVHASTPNIIHVESPTKRIYKLGDFFGIWKATQQTAQPAGDAYVKALESAATKGDVTVYLNGKPWTRGYQNVPLKEHAVITVEIGKPIVPPRSFNNWQGT